MIKDVLLQIIKEKGWLAIESLYFDNGLVVSIENMGGKIAISEANDILVFLSSIDIIQSETVGSTIALYMSNEIGHVSTLTMASLSSLQRFNMATYYKSGANDQYPLQPFPSNYLNPTEADLPTLEDDVYDGELVLNRKKPFDPENPKERDWETQKVKSIFDDYDPKVNINRAYYNLKYLKDIWFKNKFIFNQRVQELTGFSDLI